MARNEVIRFPDFHFAIDRDGMHEVMAKRLADMVGVFFLVKVPE